MRTELKGWELKRWELKRWELKRLELERWELKRWELKRWELKRLEMERWELQISAAVSVLVGWGIFQKLSVVRVLEIGPDALGGLTPPQTPDARRQTSNKTRCLQQAPDTKEKRKRNKIPVAGTICDCVWLPACLLPACACLPAAKRNVVNENVTTT